MCGILGVAGAQEHQLDANTLQRALSCIKHRGPDDEGYILYSTRAANVVEAAGNDTVAALGLPLIKFAGDREFDVALAHRRLSIIDVSPAGHQPMRSRDGRHWIIFNGEIYNYLELREELQQLGHQFRSNSDTEVILAAYQRWGAEMLPRFVGMFALAVLDTTAKTIFLARDPFGIKPLYWARSGSAFLFASEIAPLLSLLPGRPRADVDALYRYMRFGVTDGHDATMFADVRLLPAAHYMEVDAFGALTVEPTLYWHPDQTSRRNISFDEAGKELQLLFDDSVRLHLRSDVPLGSCLSGGLDSTAIVSSMRRQLGAGVPIHAFSYINEDPLRGEGPYVDIAAEEFDLVKHLVSPGSSDLLNDLETLVRIQEQPFDTTSIYAQYSVFRLAQAHGVKVMLDGQGSDELFGGYATGVSAQLSAAILKRDVGAVRSLIGSPHMSGRALRTRISMSALGRLLPTAVVPFFMELAGESLYPNWMNGSWFRNRGHRAAPRPQGRGQNALREELIHFVQTMSLPRLLRYEDRNSMAFSIESRVPFCTVPLADFALSLPPEFLIDWQGETKAVLRHAMRGLVPRAIIERPKVGFETPERAWLSSLRPWIADVTQSDSFRSLPFMSHAVVDGVIDAQLANTASFQPLTWRFLNVAAWARTFDVRFDE